MNQINLFPSEQNQGGLFIAATVFALPPILIAVIKMVHLLSVAKLEKMVFCRLQFVGLLHYLKVTRTASR